MVENPEARRLVNKIKLLTVNTWEKRKAETSKAKAEALKERTTARQKRRRRSKLHPAVAADRAKASRCYHEYEFGVAP